MPAYPYVTLDVFTTTRFGGNPLAVVLDGRGLDDATMLAIAREFNYSETTFVLPPADADNTAQVRIFTPGGEVPFAGHPNVGTAWALAQEGTLFGRTLGDEVRFEEGAGLVPVTILRAGGAMVGTRLQAPRAPEIGPAFDPALVAPAAGLAVADIATAAHPPVSASVGLGFVCVEVATLAALGRARGDEAALERLAIASGAEPGHLFMLYLYTRDTGEEGRLHARMFAAQIGVDEDPATGSAAGALGGLLATLAARAGAPDGTLAWRIDQGVEMGRPSRIDVAADIAGGAVTRVTVAGSCVPVMRGVLEA
jgi:trans-2,3-dihydro-3-hydroxyanthranilate isomerase